MLFPLRGLQVEPMLVRHQRSQGYGSPLGFAVQIGTVQKNINVTLQTYNLSLGNLWRENMRECKITCISGLPLTTCFLRLLRLRIHTYACTHACVCVSLSLSIDTVLFVVCVNNHRASTEPYLALSSMDYTGYLVQFKCPSDPVGGCDSPLPLSDVRGIKVQYSVSQILKATETRSKPKSGQINAWAFIKQMT